MPTRHLGKFSRHRKFSIFIYSLVGIIIFTSLLLYYVGNKMWPVLVRYAKTDANHVITEVANQAVQKEIIQLLSDEELFVVEKETDGTITMIDFDSVILNQLLQKTNTIIQSYLLAVEEGNVDFLKENNITLDNVLLQKLAEGRIALVPMGIATGNALLANLGPKIPVRIHFIGNVSSHVKSKVENYGINNALLSSYIQVSITAEVILPLSIDQIDLTIDIPLSIKMIQGKVPTYYQSGYHDNSSLLTLPIDPVNP